jgi:hypothetical protein
MVRNLKVERSQTLVWGLPDRICRLDPKSLKKISERQINYSERKFSQKCMFSTLKV